MYILYRNLSNYTNHQTVSCLDIVSLMLGRSPQQSSEVVGGGERERGERERERERERVREREREKEREIER